MEGRTTQQDLGPFISHHVCRCNHPRQASVTDMDSQEAHVDPLAMACFHQHLAGNKRAMI